MRFELEAWTELAGNPDPPRDREAYFDPEVDIDVPVASELWRWRIASCQPITDQTHRIISQLLRPDGDFRRP